MYKSAENHFEIIMPKLLKGSSHEDTRGTLIYNNDFDATAIKRIYVIENTTADVIRAWQGHQIEQRWFSALKGSFKIELIAIADWNRPNKKIRTFGVCARFQKNWMYSIFPRVM